MSFTLPKHQTIFEVLDWWTFWGDLSRCWGATRKEGSIRNGRGALESLLGVEERPFLNNTPNNQLSLSLSLSVEHRPSHHSCSTSLPLLSSLSTEISCGDHCFYPSHGALGALSPALESLIQMHNSIWNASLFSRILFFHPSLYSHFYPTQPQNSLIAPGFIALISSCTMTSSPSRIVSQSHHHTKTYTVSNLGRKIDFSNRSRTCYPNQLRYNTIVVLLSDSDTCAKRPAFADRRNERYTSKRTIHFLLHKCH